MTTALAPYTPPAALLREPSELFATAPPANPLAKLFAYRAETRAEIEQVSAYATGALGRVYGYFTRGNGRDGNHALNSMVAERLFRADGAIRALDASCWRDALALTDVLQHMTAEKRDAWHDQLEKLDTPPFEPAVVAETLRDLLAQRADLLAERVDGIFRRLSGEHVTNRPQGFSTRMILRWVHDGTGYISPGRGDCEAVSDLRCVVARFMGRDEPGWWTTSKIIKEAYEQHGEWLDLDGGSVRIRVYKRGTGHLEVHPEMAWRLNAILAHRYPRAIAAEARQRPAKPRKEWATIERPLPTAVVDALCNLSSRDGWEWSLGYSSGPAKEEAIEILTRLGGVLEDRYKSAVTFPYDATDVIRELIARGTVPDQVSHQYYPTPETVADAVMAVVGEIPAGATILEPSAGTGALADRLAAAARDWSGGSRPADAGRVTCVELSPLHAEVLRAKGHDVHQGDFLAWQPPAPIDLVVMNPPFADGRWRAHVEHAATMVRTGGRLVAVLPATVANGGAAVRDVQRALGRGWDGVRYSEPMPFPGTSISVVVVDADRAAAAEVAA